MCLMQRRSECREKLGGRWQLFKGINQPGNSTDGANPNGRLALGPDGTIYGTTEFGGSPSSFRGCQSSLPMSAMVWSVPKA